MTLGFTIDSFSILSWMNNKKFLYTIPIKAKIISFVSSALALNGSIKREYFMGAASLNIYRVYTFFRNKFPGLFQDSD